MTGPEPLLDRAGIERAFRVLGDRLHRRGVIADVYVVGGAAMVLAYDARRATRDIDAVFHPHGVVLDEAHQVAAELGLPWYWLNDQASVYVSRTEDRQAVRVFDHPGVRVSAASAEHLLAMKALAGRRFADHDDLATLIRILGLSSVAQVAEICARVFPEEPLSDRARLLVEDVLDELRKSGEGAP